MGRGEHGLAAGDLPPALPPWGYFLRLFSCILELMNDVWQEAALPPPPERSRFSPQPW